MAGAASLDRSAARSFPGRGACGSARRFVGASVAPVRLDDVRAVGRIWIANREARTAPFTAHGPHESLHRILLKPERNLAGLDPPRADHHEQARVARVSDLTLGLSVGAEQEGALGRPAAAHGLEHVSA